MTWASAGASAIAITGRAKALLDETAAEITRISPKTKVLALTAEATSEADVKQLWMAVKAEIGIIDVLIANAGVFSEGVDLPLTGSIAPSQWWGDMVNPRSLPSSFRTHLLTLRRLGN